MLLTTQQVADRLNVKRQTVRELINENKLRAFKMRVQWRVSESDLERFINQNTNMAGS